MDLSTLLETLLIILKALAGVIFAIVAVVAAIIVADFIIQAVRLLVKSIRREGTPRWLDANYYEQTSFCQLPGKSMILVPNPDSEAEHYAEDGPVADSVDGYKIMTDEQEEHEPDCHCMSCQIDRRMEKEDRARDDRIDRELEDRSDR